MLKYYFLLAFLFSTVEAGMLDDYYKTEFKNIGNSTQAIIAIDTVLNSFDFSESHSSKDYYTIAYLERDRLYFESIIVIKEEQRMTREQWFSSGYFKSNYVKIGQSFEYALDKDLAELSLTTKELSAIYANPFLGAEVKEKAYKHSLLILSDEDIGTGEHPLTKDQYVGRIYERMMQDYCSQGKCSEVKRLAEELATYSEENRLLADKLLSEFAVPSESEETQPKSTEAVGETDTNDSVPTNSKNEGSDGSISEPPQVQDDLEIKPSSESKSGEADVDKSFSLSNVPMWAYWVLVFVALFGVYKTRNRKK